MMYTKHEKLITVVLAALLAALVVFIIILSSVPPVSRDALTHHLAVPKLWLAHGGIYEMPDLPFSYYPMNLDLLYLIPLYFGNDIIPKYIHFAFALATAWLIFTYLNSRTNRGYALTGALFFLTTPVIVKLSISAYVDLGLIFFTTLALLFLIRWAENEFRLRYLIVSAVSCGLAMGTKYNGLISLFLLAFIPPYVYLEWSRSDLKKATMRLQAKALGYGMVFVAIAGLIYLPWMAKNYVWTGNPLYPLFDKHEQTPQSNEGRAPKSDGTPTVFFEDELGDPFQKTSKIDSHFVVRKLVYGESWWETATIPIRVFFQGQDDNPKYFDGRLNPCLLIFPLFVFLRPAKYQGRVRREARLLAVFALFYTLFVFFRIDMRIRWIAPMIPALVILSIIGLSRAKQWCHVCVKPKTGTLCVGFFWIAVTIMFTLNVVYMRDLYKKVDPVSYLSGQISRDDYIQRFHAEYGVIRFANQDTDPDAVILGLFLGNRRYYSDREMNFDYDYFKHAVRKSASPKEAADFLKTGGITHLIIRHDLFKKWYQDNFTQAEKKMVSLLLEQYTEMLYTKSGYTLFKI